MLVCTLFSLYPFIADNLWHYPSVAQYHISTALTLAKVSNIYITPIEPSIAPITLSKTKSHFLRMFAVDTPNASLHFPQRQRSPRSFYLPRENDTNGLLASTIGLMTTDIYMIKTPTCKARYVHSILGRTYPIHHFTSP